MTPGNGRAPGMGGDSHKVIQPTATNSTRIIPTQQDRVKRFLERGWTCGIDFLNPADGYPPILRYTGRIHELRKDGWLIDRRECCHPWHNHVHSTMWQWKLVGHVNDGTLPGIGGAS